MSGETLSCGLHTDDPVHVRIVRRKRYSPDRLNDAQQLQHLWQRGDALFFRPGRDLRNRQVQDLGQMGIAGEAEPAAQRALTHAAVDKRANYLPLSWRRAGATSAPPNMEAQQRQGAGCPGRLRPAGRQVAYRRTGATDGLADLGIGHALRLKLRNDF